MKSLERFIKAQEFSYTNALNEIKSGHKQSHWIWYIFPQISGLGQSYQCQQYGIQGIEEAKAYLNEPILRKRLLEISNALLELESNDPIEVMGSYIDAKKLRSSMTLFLEADSECKVFKDVLEKYYHGKKDDKTLKLLDKKE